MSSNAGQKRLLKEVKMLHDEPMGYCHASPDHANLFKWYYVIRGPDDSVFKGGIYVGTFELPKNWPFSPPDIEMITPNGRFSNGKICTTFSAFHKDSWNTSWTIRALCSGMLSFMLDLNSRTHIGAIPNRDPRQLKTAEYAQQSFQYNKQKIPKFTELFPELIEEYEKLSPKERCAEYLPSQSGCSVRPKITFNRLKAEAATANGKLERRKEKEFIYKHVLKTGYDECKEIDFEIKIIVSSDYPYSAPTHISFPAVSRWTKEGDKKTEKPSAMEKERKKAQKKLAKFSFVDLEMDTSGNLKDTSRIMKNLKKHWNPKTSSLLNLSKVVSLYLDACVF